MVRFLSAARPKKLKGTALVRLDFNTEDEWRMQATLPTLRYLLRHAAKVVVVSHRGRPRGVDKTLSLRKDAVALGRFLGRRVVFIPHLRFADIRKQIMRAPHGSLFLIENLRFDKGEENNTLLFAKRLASLGDYYVNDAFAVSHRDDASVDAITRYMPSYAGFELEKEIAFLSRLLQKPKHPLIIILGGGKAHDKLGVLTRFLSRADAFLLGGGTANTILMLRGVNVMRSIVETDAQALRGLARIAYRKNIIIPTDCAVWDHKMLDIGPKAGFLFAQYIRRARTIIWSGPMGVIEQKPYDRGTLAIARAIAANRRAYKVAGGGETVMFLKQHRLDKKFTFISTGGGAMVDFLAGEKLPGIAALHRRTIQNKQGALKK